MKPETQTDQNINEGSSQSQILTKVYLRRVRLASERLSKAGQHKTGLM